jgi:hypothetical protein
MSDEQTCLEISFEYLADDDTGAMFRLFENGVAIEENGAPLFSVLMTGKNPGEYSYQVMTVKGDFESDLSEPLKVNFMKPNPPTNLTARWVKCTEASVGGSVG